MLLGNAGEDFWQTPGYVIVEFSNLAQNLIYKYLFIAGKHIEERNISDRKKDTRDPLGTLKHGYT